MSWRAQRWAHGKGKQFELDPNHRWMLINLANYADDEGNNIFPSLRKLEMETGFSETSLRRHIKHLHNCGLIEYGDQAAAEIYRAGSRPKVYRLTMTPRPELSQSGPKETTQADAPQTEGSQDSHLGGPNTGTTLKGKPKNPKENLCTVCDQLRPAAAVDSSGKCADCRDFRPGDAERGAAYLAQRLLAKQAKRFGTLP